MTVNKGCRDTPPSITDEFVVHQSNVFRENSIQGILAHLFIAVTIWCFAGFTSALQYWFVQLACQRSTESTQTVGAPVARAMLRHAPWDVFPSPGGHELSA